MNVECSEETCKHSAEGVCTKEKLDLRRADEPEENADGSERALLDCFSYEREEETEPEYNGDKDE